MLLLPFEGKIIYDGMMSYLKFDFTENEIENLTDVYESILEDESIITELSKSRPKGPKFTPVYNRAYNVYNVITIKERTSGNVLSVAVPQGAATNP